MCRLGGSSVRLYYECTIEQGWSSGGLWSGIKDWVYVEKRPKSVLDDYSWRNIHQEMRERFEVGERIRDTLVRPIAQPATRLGPAPFQFVQVRETQFWCRGYPCRLTGFNGCGGVHPGVVPVLRHVIWEEDPVAASVRAPALGPVDDEGEVS